MANGLFYVYTDPGTVPEAEFHDWYDHEHGPRPADRPRRPQRLPVPRAGRGEAAVARAV